MSGDRRLRVPIGRRGWLAAAGGGLLGAGGIWWLRSRSRRDFRWYEFVYRAAYQMGLAVWQRDASPPELVDLVEGPSPLSPGRALDVGCGTGTDSIYLSQHGWDVTGVDMVAKALVRAHRRAATAGVTPRLVNGDATRLRELGVGDGFTLLLIFGCFHTLPEDRRPLYVAGVSEVAAPGATLLLYGFTRPPRAAPMYSRVSTQEVEGRFGQAWELLSSSRSSVGQLDVAGRRADDLFELWSYRLRRR